MATVSDRPPETLGARRPWSARLRIPEMWASVAITAMWLAVAVVALFGPDIVSSSAGSYTRIPSAIIVAFFAYLGTRVVARYGLGDGRTERRS